MTKLTTLSLDSATTMFERVEYMQTPATKSAPLRYAFLILLAVNTFVLAGAASFAALFFYR